MCGADVHDLHLAERLLEGMGRGWVLADRNYWSPNVREQLSDYEGGPTLLARFKRNNETEKQRGLVWPRWLSNKRQKIESIFSQLVERYQMKVVWARDTWHFCIALCTQDPEPHHGSGVLPEGRDICYELLGAPHRLNLHIGLKC